MDALYKNLRHLLESCWEVVKAGYPARKLVVIGVTGTDGKTTTSHLIYEMLKAAKFKVALVSTVAAYIGNEEKRALLHHYLIQAQIFGPFSLFSTAIFFYGKDIWRNIRKRDLILH